ncbi:28S ribosomal protein S11, mitochondrial [Suncus etruscus]|uniref:28S ribosomal protein S11, mitochondrial n=1 Tax=Suncus etruscus TaxID=109475 RepID=UPI0021107E4E|nr:28S ribosomal protein S11, mitochondrial [Suncus etruscus]
MQALRKKRGLTASFGGPGPMPSPRAGSPPKWGFAPCSQASPGCRTQGPRRRSLESAHRGPKPQQLQPPERPRKWSVGSVVFSMSPKSKGGIPRELASTTSTGQESPLRWAGRKFEEIPIAHIKASHNNTQIQVVSAANQPLARTSCGTEGFTNAKKGTGIAAQTAGIAAASKALGKGVTHIRVVVKGLGPGRLSAIKGLTMGGLEVISITDNTPVPHNGCRPRKARRL